MQQKESGFLLVNKPTGITSHDVVYRLRKITNIKKIGHAGTLDPFAKGLLILAITRQATKNINHFVKLDKNYLAKIKLGQTSSTYDPEGTISNCQVKAKPKLNDIKRVCQYFIGEIKQEPPMFSAKKIQGKKLYQLARQGKTIKREKVNVHIYSIKIKKYKWPDLTIETKVSSGTYIRSLAHDIGQALAIGAFCKELTRTAIDKYKLKKAIDLEKLNQKNWHKYLFLPKIKKK